MHLSDITRLFDNETVSHVKIDKALRSAKQFVYGISTGDITCRSIFIHNILPKLNSSAVSKGYYLHLRKVRSLTII